MTSTTASQTKRDMIKSTAGAISVRNEKGEISMEKVKVHRYISGKRPDYAPDSSSGEESGDETFQGGAQVAVGGPMGRRALEDVSSEDEDGRPSRAAQEDRRLRRLQRAEADEEEEDESGLEVERGERKRRITIPEILEEAEAEEEILRHLEENEAVAGGPSVGPVSEPMDVVRGGDTGGKWGAEDAADEGDDEMLEKRRALLRERARALRAKEDEELLAHEEEAEGEESSSSEEESSDEEYSSGSDGEGARLKPVFVRKRDRLTIQEKAKEELKEKQRQIEAKNRAEERRRHTLKMIEEDRKGSDRPAVVASGVSQHVDLSEVVTDDENDEAEYEAWKVRELKRIKRDREERDNRDKELAEIERLRTMTEEERRAELKSNPRVITNKATKGKYKFLQKYYHRGAFYVDEEERVLKQDFSAPTGEDRFDKSVLPKVMQVKNFGRSGRTKYTHLVDQDTTDFESPWISETAHNLKYHNAHGGGMKQVFDRPGAKKRRNVR